MTTGLSHAELIDWIRLARSPGIGAKTFRQLLHRFGAAFEAIAHMPDWGGRQKQAEVPPPSIAEREFAVATKAGLQYLPWSDPRYPEPLAALDDAPPLLLVKGRLDVLATPLIGIGAHAMPA